MFESIGAGAGFVLTLFVFSYLLGDNFLYRLAVYVLVGIAAAFTAIVTVEGFIVPLLTADGDNLVFSVILLAISAGLVLLLLLKGRPGLTPITNVALAFLVAVGAAVAVTGAVTGTIIPLVTRTAAVQGNLLDTIIIVVGAVTSLLYFQFWGQRTASGGTRRRNLAQMLALIGQGFIAVTLGALYATAIITSLTILTERMFVLLGG